MGHGVQTVVGRIRETGEGPMVASLGAEDGVGIGDLSHPTSPACGLRGVITCPIPEWTRHLG